MKRQQEPRHGKFGTNLNSCSQGFGVLEVGILHIGPEHLGLSMPLARLRLDERHRICRVYFLSRAQTRSL